MINFIMSKEFIYRFTVGCWFILGVVLGGLTVRVMDTFDYLEKNKPEYTCFKGIAYQGLGEGDSLVYVKTNLQCLED